MKERLSHSPEETFALGKELIQQYPNGALFCFYGDLGAGKTTLIKGIVHAATGTPPGEVQSPTFTYMHVYEGEQTVYHFDLYRLWDSDEFLSMGFEEYFDLPGYCCLEWSERIAPLIPPEAVRVTLTHEGEQCRKITIEQGVPHE